MWQFSLPMMQCPHATHKFVSHLVSWDEDVEIGISISIKNNKLRRKNSTQRQHNTCIKVVNFVSMVHISSHINVYFLRKFFFPNDPLPIFLPEVGTRRPDHMLWCHLVEWQTLPKDWGDQQAPQTWSLSPTEIRKY